MNLGGFSSQGYLDYVNQSAERNYKDALTKQYLQKMQQEQTLFQEQQQAKQNALKARSGAGADILALGGQMPGSAPAGGLPPPPGAAPGAGPSSMAAFGPPPGQMPQPPMPGQSSQPQGQPQGPPQGMPPPQQPMGPQPGAGMSPGMPKPPMPAAMSPSWQQMPKPGASPQPQPGQSQLPPPPAAPPQQQAPQPGGMDIKSLAAKWKAEGVPVEQVMDRLDALTPFMTAQNKAELAQAQMGLKLQTEIANFAHQRAQELQKEAELAERTRSDKAREGTAERRIDIHIGDQTAKRAGDGGFGGANGELMAALAERGVSLPAGFRSKEQQKAMLSSLIKRNPDTSVDEIADKIKNGQIDLNAERASGRAAGGIAGKVAYAEREIEEIAPLVREASLKVPREKFVPWNKLKQYTGTQLSDPNLKELHSYLTTMSNAYDMLAARGGTDKDKRAENHRLLDSAESPEALERAIKVMENEAKAAGRAAEKSIKTSGRNRDNTEPAPTTNAKGWTLHTDKAGNKAYVSPDGKQFEEVK